MMSRSVLAWAPFIAFVAAGVTALSCGDDGGPDPPLSEYFDQYQTVHTDINSRIAALDERYPLAFEEDVEQTKQLFREYVDLFNEFLDRAAELEPTEEVEDLHREILADNRSLNDINEARLQQLEGAEMIDEVNEIFGPDEEFAAIVARTEDQRCELEQVAADNDIDLDLACE